MALLDAYGRPIQTRTLAEPQAVGGITGVRQVWSETVAAGLTPQRLAGILLACDQGELTEFLTLAEEMEERDPHYGSVLGMRKRAISGAPVRVDPCGIAEIDKAVQEQIAEHDGFPGLIEDLLDSLGKGFSVVEIHWAADKSRWWPGEFRRVEPRWLRYDRETGRELRLRDEAAPVDGIELAPGHFIRHEARLKSGLAFRGGLARLVAFSWMCKAYTVKDWVAFIETYGLPLRLGRYGPEATKQDVAALYRAVANIGTDAAAVLPRAMEIQFEQAAAAGTASGIFENLARWVDEQVSKAVLGQTMTSDDGSSQAQAKVHDGVRHDIARSDARSLTAAINRDLVRTFVDANWGVQKVYPRLIIDIAEPEDVAAIMTHVPKLAAAGMRFKAAEIRGKLGFGEPEKGDEIFGGAAAEPKAPASPGGQEDDAGEDEDEDEDGDDGEKDARNRACACPSCQALALNRSGSDPMDDIREDALADWEDVTEELVGPAERAILDAGSYEEAMAALAVIAPRMGTSRLIDGLVKAMFAARAQGDRQDG